MLPHLALFPRLRSLPHVAERTGRIGSLLAYVVVSALGLAAGAGAVQLLAGPDDEIPVSTAPTIEEVGIAP